MSTNSIILDVRHLNVDYFSESGTVHAVSDVSFTLQRGEVLGLAGESGSGKSTLVYALTRLLPNAAEITGGQALYYPSSRDDRVTVHKSDSRNADIDPSAPMDLLRLTPAQLQTVRWSELAIVFQSAMNALNPVMTVGSQIIDVFTTHRPEMSGAARVDRAKELLKLVGIAPDRLNSYPHELSGGMRQRAVIAIALALNPEIIIMDEPTTALDVVVQHEILAEILRLRDEFNFAVIFITHDLSLLLELADTIAIMYAGRVVEQASQDDLTEHPTHPYSYGLINSFPSLHGPRRKAAGIPGSPPDLRAIPPGCAFHPRCPFAFDACRVQLPLLRPTHPDRHQVVACHLYDPSLSAAPPTTADLAAKYDAIAEGSGRA